MIARTIEVDAELTPNIMEAGVELTNKIEYSELPSYDGMTEVTPSSETQILETRNTALYENIFIDEETADIALLKSMGFSKNTIRTWHFLRLMLLAAFSLILTYVFMATGGNFLIGNLFKSIMKCGAFSLKVLPVNNFVIVPVLVLAGLALVISLMAEMTGRIQIWKVRNE